MKPRCFLILALAAGLLTGCLFRADRTKFYFLSAPERVPSDSTLVGRSFLVGLRVTSDEYLRTKQMLVQLGPNQLRLSDENEWEETPQAGFARVLAKCLEHNFPDCELTPLPCATTNKPELILEVELSSMQGRLQPKSEAEVSAEIRILDGKSRLLERDELRKTSPWSPTAPPDGYAALAAAESVAAAALADEIGKEVMACHRRVSDH
jgi:uncharacterized lipoprotein YmbA